MSSYFKFVGVFELISFAVGEVILLVTFFQSLSTSLWWMYLLILIVVTIFGPAVGLLFFSYGNHLEECQASSGVSTGSSKNYSNSSNVIKTITFSSVYFNGKSIDRIKKIVAIESSKNFTKLEVDKMDDLEDSELNDLYEKTFSNKAKPIVKELSEISIQNDMIKIGGTAYNLKLMSITGYEVKPIYISFNVYSTSYLILYSNASEANRLYDLIKNSIKED